MSYKILRETKTSDRIILGDKTVQIFEVDNLTYIQIVKPTAFHVIHITEFEEWHNDRMLSTWRKQDTLKKFRSVKKAIKWCEDTCGTIRWIKDKKFKTIEEFKEERGL